MKIKNSNNKIFKIDLTTNFSKIKEDWIKSILNFENLSNTEIDTVVEEITNYFFYIHGYPYDIVYSIEDQLNDFKKLKCSLSKTSNKIVPKSNLGIKSILSRFKFRQDIEIFEKIPPTKIFEDKNKLRDLIIKVLMYGKYSSWQSFYSQFKSFLQIYSGVQIAGFFKPESAKCIYDEFGEFESVWDMSVGFGGRMIGGMASEYVKHYIGTEPSTKAFGDLVEIKHLINKNNKIHIFRSGSEDFIPDKNSLSLCFTSPPYYKQEQYSLENSQSYIKYGTQDSWLYDFFGKTIENCRYGLKNKGILIINIADVTSFPTLTKESKLLIEDIGFKHVDTYYLPISQVPSRKNLNINSEPILIFKKIT